MSLENTTWLATDRAGNSTTLAFGESKSSGGAPGGYGTSTVNYPGSGPVVTNITWKEDGYGNFMYQVKGPTDPGNTELPTTFGMYREGFGLGWGTNFDADWTATSTWGYSMVQQ